MSSLLLNRLHDDDGISLVEILVAVVIIGVSLTAFTSTLAQSVVTISRDEQLVRGNQLAADLLEGVRAMRWTTVGFYGNDPGYSATAADGAATVNLGANRPAAAPAPRLAGSAAAPVLLLPRATILRDGITYTMTLDIVWQDDPNQPAPPTVDPDPKDYKEMRVTLDWMVRDRAFQTSAVAIRQPTREEVPVGTVVTPCTPGTITSLDISPDFVQVTPSGITQQDITVSVTTCSSTSQVRLYPRPLADFNMTVNSSSGNTFFSIDPFRAGVTTFNPGDYVWTAVATGPAGTHSVDAGITFFRQDTAVLDVISLTTSTQRSGANVMCGVGAGGAIPAAVTLTAKIAGAASADRVTISWTSQAGTATASTGSPDGNGNLNFSVTVPSGHKFNRTITTVTVSVTRTTTDNLNVTESFSVPVRSVVPCP